MLDVLARSERHVDGVELDDLAGPGGLGGLGQALGEVAFGGPFPVRAALRMAGTGSMARRLTRWARMRPTVASDTVKLPAQLDDDLGLAPGRLLEPPFLDGLYKLAGPGGLADRLGPPRLESSVPGPAIESGRRLPTALAAWLAVRPSRRA